MAVSKSPTIGRKLLRGVGLVATVIVGVVVVVIVVVLIVVSSAFAKQHKEMSDSEVATFNAIVLPQGYKLLSQSTEEIAGPLGSTPEHIYQIEVPPGKSRQAVVNDLAAAGPSQKLEGQGATFNTFGLVVTGHSNASILFKPYINNDVPHPDLAVSSLQITISY